MTESIFEVTRADYKGFVAQIKSEAREVKVEEPDNRNTITKIFSKKTGKCLCSRLTHHPLHEGEDPLPEQYYIFEMPEDDERAAPTPVYQLKLETKEEVQAFFDFIAAQNKEKEND